MFFSDWMSLRRLAKLYKIRARVQTCQLVQYKRINKIFPLWAKKTTVFVFRGYLSRVKLLIFELLIILNIQESRMNNVNEQNNVQICFIFKKLCTEM